MVSRIPNDIFQFSTVSALIGGLATHGPKVSQLGDYGTHGIGTFTRLNGELLYIDGQAWQFTSDGKTRHAPTDVSMPFVQVTKFVPEYTAPVKPNTTKEDLIGLISAAGPDSGGKNSFVPFMLKGSFAKLYIRAAGPQLFEGQGLTEVARNAKQWTLENQKGVMFGFISPEWAQGISVAGVHCHFISDPDQDGQVQGGHIQEFEIQGDVEISWSVTGRYHLGMPRGEEWERLELATVDRVGINEAEGLGHAGHC